ncbi:MAG: MFS transporter [Hyphomicrobiales bacterium]
MGPSIAILALGYILSQFYRVFLAVLADDLSTDLGATPTELSLASGAWFIMFAVAQFPVGIWLDKYGPRRMTAALFTLGAGGGIFCLSIATTPIHLIGAMGLIGIGCSPVLMAPIFIFAKSFSAARFGLLAAWFVAFGTIGNVAGAKPLEFLATQFGWRPILLGLLVLTVAVGVAVFLFVKDPPQEEVSREPAAQSSFLVLLKMKSLWPIFPVMAVFYAIPVGFRGYWIAPYLSNVYGLDSAAVGTLTLWMAIAMICGSIAYGPLDRWAPSRKWLSITGGTLVVGSMLVLAIWTASSLSLATAMLVLCGFAGMGYPVLMAHARQFFPPNAVGRGVTLLNFFSIGGVGVMQWTSAALISDETIQNAPVTAFQTLFWFYAISLGIALLVYLAARERPDIAQTNG